MLTKEYRATFKAAKDEAGEPTGEVTAIVSVFKNVDLVGDVVAEGAFDGTLQEWKDSGDHIPMIWSHDWANPMSHIGAWDPAKAKATKEGLELTGQVFIGQGNPVADQAFKLMENRLVREFSFAYDVIEEHTVPDGDQKGANSLDVLGLIEAGPTLKGANPATRLVDAKSLEQLAEALGVDAKAGRALSSKNETSLRDAAEAIRNAAKAIDAVLESVDPEPAQTEEKSEDVEYVCGKCEAEFKDVDALQKHADAEDMEASLRQRLAAVSLSLD